jgi:hypothetical protein
LLGGGGGGVGAWGGGAAAGAAPAVSGPADSPRAITPARPTAVSRLLDDIRFFKTTSGVEW